MKKTDSKICMSEEELSQLLKKREWKWYLVTFLLYLFCAAAGFFAAWIAIITISKL